MPERQRYRLRARSDREVIREVEPGTVYVDRESGEEFQVVGKLLPKDLNDCLHCGRRLPAIER